MIAVFSYLLVPGWRSSPPGIAVLIACVVVGVYAVFKDMQNFLTDLNAQQKGEEKKDEPPDQGGKGS